MNVLKGATTEDSRLDHFAWSLQRKTAKFEEVIVMIDDMVALLGKEQSYCEEKQQYCEAKFDTLEEETKSLARAISNLFGESK